MRRKLLVIATVLAMVMFLSLQQPSNAEAAPKLHQVQGKGSFVASLIPVGPEFQTTFFQFHVKEDSNGVVKGTAHFDIIERTSVAHGGLGDGEFAYNFDVAMTCIRVNGNSAVLGGIVTQASTFGFHRVGTEVNWIIVDADEQTGAPDAMGRVFGATGPQLLPSEPFVGGCIIRLPISIRSSSPIQVDGHIRID
jgi:hypothetical protein